MSTSIRVRRSIRASEQYGTEEQEALATAATTTTSRQDQKALASNRQRSEYEIVGSYESYSSHHRRPIPTLANRDGQIKQQRQQIPSDIDHTKQIPGDCRAPCPNDASVSMQASSLYYTDDPNSHSNNNCLPETVHYQSYRNQHHSSTPNNLFSQTIPGNQRMALKLGCQPQHHQPHHQYPIAGGGWQSSALNTFQYDSSSLNECIGLDCEHAQESDCSCSNSINSLDQPVAPFLQHQPIHHPTAPAATTTTTTTTRIQHHRPQHSNSAEQQLQHQPQNFHRPLMPHSSVPPLPSASTRNSQNNSPPPPLVRQATYTATIDTITDHNLPDHSVRSQKRQQLAENQQPHHQVAIPRTSPPPANLGERSDRLMVGQQQQQQKQFTSNTGTGDFGAIQATNERGLASGNCLNGTNGGNYRHDSTSLIENLNQKNPVNKHYNKQKQSVSFRRSATSDQAEVVKLNNKQHNFAYNTLTHYNSFATDDGTIGTKPLDSRHKSHPLHEQRTANYNSTPNTQSKQPVSSAGQQRQQHSTSGRGSTNISSSTDTPNITDHIGGHFQVGGMQNCPNTPSLSGHFHVPNLGSVTPIATYPPRSPLGTRGGHLIPGTPIDGTCAIPVITSHRTNSPWMRISSIILTPIGIIIVLFIVVSPLLHYLM